MSRGKEIQHFFNITMIRLGFHEWKLKVVPNSREGYCWLGKKVIEIGSENYRLLLHEIAHIGTARFCNNKHDLSFWRRYEDLMDRFSPQVMLEKRYNQDIGFYRKCYASSVG